MKYRCDICGRPCVLISEEYPWVCPYDPTNDAEPAWRMEINPMKKLISIYILTVKYWAEGQSWREAWEHAQVLVRGWR